MNEKAYTTFQVADICGVHPMTIIKWVNDKKIKAYVTPGRHRRILQSELLNFLKKYDFPVPKDLSQSHKRVLIIEDDPAVGRLLQKVFQKASNDIEVEWIQDSIKALMVLGERTPNLIILDVVMPVMDGAQLLSRLRSYYRTHRVKVIGITGKHLPPEKLKFMQNNTDAFYLKPFNMNELVRKAMSLLRGRYEKMEPYSSGGR